MSALKFAAVGAAAAAVNYVEDVFSTYLYTGNGATQTITNGIDLAGNGGLVWIKDRDLGYNHILVDTSRGQGKYLVSNLTAQESGVSTTVTNFNANGFSIGATVEVNRSSFKYASWTFRKQPKFFDVVTYTGNGVQGRQISHALESTPGCIIVKCTSTTSNWTVYHRSLTTNYILQLNSQTNAINVGSPNVYVSAPTDTTFTVGNDSDVNANGATYVAYLFAHNAGGFGLTGTDNVISCGSWTGGAPVVLGYEPQWVLIKKTSAAQSWFLMDNMRGLDVSQGEQALSPNTNGAEPTASGNLNINSTGFQAVGLGADPYIYIAIRRGPMKVPTVGTSVFAVETEGQFSPKPPGHTSGFVTDMAWVRNVTTTNSMIVASRLTGNKYLVTSSTAAEASLASINFAYMNGWLNISTTNPQYYSWMFRRAPGFFDEVCYTGTGTTQAITHNLGIAPELIIAKSRSSGTDYWSVQCPAVANAGKLNTNDSFGFSAHWSPITSTSITGDGDGSTNGSAKTYVAYLFATCAGVSKVGSYTGTGAAQTINCGFTAGSRFVLIKRTDSTGDWYIWDSARGIVAGNDPHLSLNSTAAEVTTDDSVDTDSSGFIVNQLAATNINVSAASYIFLAIS